MSDFRWTGAEVVAALEAGRADFVEAVEGLSPPDGPLGGQGYGRVWTDSRSLQPGDLFVALVGDRFDGHDFIRAASTAGATGVVVSREVDDMPAGMAAFRVDDTLLALGDLAAHRRRALAAQVVGLTGSSGKTTTKEFLRAAVAGERRVHATEANLNNRIGAAQTLLAAPDDAEVVIVEMGTSEPGEIARLAEIGEPDLAIVITVAESHLDLLRDFDGVMEEKLDLIRGRRDGGASLVGDRPPELPVRAREIDPGVGVVGETAGADAALRPTAVEVDGEGRVSFSWNGERVALKLPGRHVAQDAWIALAAAEWLGVSTAAAARGIGAVEGGRMRNELRRVGAVDLIVDCYNANPQSTVGAIDALAARDGVRVALLGSMLELGGRGPVLHAEVLRHALDAGIDLVVASGDYLAAADGISSDRLILRADPSDGVPLIVDRIRGREASVLIKGSRGVRMETLLPHLERALAAEED